jgi:hypothetical protein
VILRPSLPLGEAHRFLIAQFIRPPGDYPSCSQFTADEHIFSLSLPLF